MFHEGGCHCGAIRVAFESALDPAATAVRACQCGFCRRHGTRTVTDPQGRLVVRVKRPDGVSAYRFGLATARYLVCATCGVYVAAITDDEPARGIVVLNALDDRDRFTAAPVPTVYDAEDRAARLQRRRTSWTPAEVVGLPR